MNFLTAKLSVLLLLVMSSGTALAAQWTTLWDLSGPEGSVTVSIDSASVREYTSGGDRYMTYDLRIVIKNTSDEEVDRIVGYKVNCSDKVVWRTSAETTFSNHATSEELTIANEDLGQLTGTEYDEFKPTMNRICRGNY
ncbi:MAG: hypothetical protein D6E12_03600 [Desulfovibrio sp.]|nr:MAG: hypothetical protein D6E12_03600 [Desulfovibrio sp.]